MSYQLLTLRRFITPPSHPSRCVSVNRVEGVEDFLDEDRQQQLVDPAPQQAGRSLTVTHPLGLLNDYLDPLVADALLGGGEGSLHIGDVVVQVFAELDGDAKPPRVDTC